MKSLFNILLLFSLSLSCIIFPSPAQAGKAKYIFKVASLAPEGSIWANSFRDFTREVIEKSNGAIGFKTYPGGVMGDDRAMYRKMRIRQIHGGGFTMTGISEVVPDFRVLGVPFLFNSYEEVDYVKEKLFPLFQKRFAEKNLELLAMSEVGFVYTMSIQPISSLEELRRSKTWIPEGDPISKVFFKTIGVSPTPLSIPDVLTSLQTGLINTVFNSFYGSIVLQWFTKTNYISDIPFAYAYGAFVLDGKTFSKLPPDLASLMKEAARKHFSLLLENTRQSNEESLQVLKKNGIKLVKPVADAKKELQEFSKKAVVKMTGKAFSQEIYDAMTQALANYRNSQTKTQRAH
jgi:TRAP-type C4-dicarboxylate transport system substrate-binding protein